LPQGPSVGTHIAATGRPQPVSGPISGIAAAEPVTRRRGVPVLASLGLLLVLGGGGTLAAWQFFGDKLFGSLQRAASLQIPTPSPSPGPTPADTTEAARRQREQASQDPAAAAERAQREAERAAAD
jgi:hypothetical protein